MSQHIAIILILIVWPLLLISGLVRPRILLFWSKFQSRWRIVFLMLTLFPAFLGIGLLIDGQVIGCLSLTPLLWPAICWKKDRAAPAVATAVPERKTIAEHDAVPEETPGTDIQVKSSSGAGFYHIFPAESRCTCPDWEECRSHLPPCHPCRVCKHLARWYTEHPDNLPEALRNFQKMIAARAADNRGMPSGEECRYGEMNGQPYAFGVSRDNWPWVDVLVGETRYGLNIEEQRWAYGRAPDCESEIIKMVTESCGLEYPASSEDLWASQNLVGDVRPEINYKYEATIEGDILPMLSEVLSPLPDGLACVQRKAYFVVYGTTPRNWFCRVKYNSYGLTEIEVNNGVIIGVSSGHVYKKSQARFVRFAEAFNWEGKKKEE